MPVADEDFIALFEQHGPAETARRLGSDLRATYARRKRLEGKIGRQLRAPEKTNRVTRVAEDAPGRIELSIKNGTVLVGGDAHFWPGIITPAWRAFLKMVKEMQPNVVVLNGDIMDGASISRHPPIGWEKRPTVVQEIETCQERLAELEAVSGKARRIWDLGNHCSRYATRLATAAPEYARVHGFSLNDHFPRWESAWSTWVNGHTVIKHRYKGGVHARHQNTVNAGINIVTNHLHNLGVTAFSDYRGTRFGADSGTLADPDGIQFLDYTEDGPKNWRAGFLHLTFSGGELLWPEVIHIRDNKLGIAEFRGKTFRV
jgi:hypothetical protein